VRGTDQAMDPWRKITPTAPMMHVLPHYYYIDTRTLLVFLFLIMLASQVEFREYGSGSNDTTNNHDYEHHDHIHIADPARHANDKERGVHASTDIPKGTLLISVPRRCIVTTDMGRTLPLAKKIKESEHHLYAPRHIYIVLYILWDITTNGSDSFFHPYYDVLPKSFPNCPIYWSPEELEYLEGSFLVNDIMRRKRAMWEDYITVRRIAKAEGERWFDGVTLEQFQWARMAIMSRNFAFVDGTQTRIWAMVPQADMLNHQRPPEVKWTFNVEEDAFLVTA
jgi:SET domain